MMLGMITGMHNEISVNDFGIQNRTIADGLAVGRASGFVGKQMLPFMDGCYSVSDERMSALLKMLADTEDIRLESSALAGMFGPIILSKNARKYPAAIIWCGLQGGAWCRRKNTKNTISMGKRYIPRFEKSQNEVDYISSYDLGKGTFKWVSAIEECSNQNERPLIFKGFSSF